jgi:WD40 repeat protein
LQNTGNILRVLVYIRSFLAHSTCIWDVDILPLHQGAPVPAGTFVTCSADNTIRFWNLDQNVESQLNLRASIAQQNVFCRELLHLIYIPTGNSKL